MQMGKVISALMLCAAALVVNCEVLKVPASKFRILRNCKEGTLNMRKNGAEIVNNSQKTWHAGMSFAVDVDLSKTPYIHVTLDELSGKGSGQIKIKAQNGKKSAMVKNVTWDPGVFSADVSKLLNLKGKQRIEVNCYAFGYGQYAVYSDVIFSSDAKAPVKPELPFYIVPTFINAAYYYSSGDIGAVTPYFRKSGASEWIKGVDAAFDAAKKQYRGSVVRLTQNTAYELKLVDRNGKTLKQGKFKTWADKIKIARTVVIDPADVKDTLVIQDKGRADGWIRYTMKKGSVIDAKFRKTVIKLDRAEYILLENLNINGGDEHAIEINNCKNIRVSNCEITGWGVVGEQRLDYNGRFHVKGRAPRGYGINLNGAINIQRGAKIVVERCYIHDPRNTSNSWYYSHPAGPQAVTVGSPVGCVIRYNDFIGSDEHRYNDAVESLGNFSKDGGLNRDADVYGNFMIFCQDDNIELDGGQQNVRCFDNRFEGSFCGVSIQGCMTGPSYVYDNTFLNMADEFGYVGYTLKSCAGPRWGALSKDNRSYIFNNTFVGNGTGTNIDVVMDYRNNIWGDTRAIDGIQKKHYDAGNVFERKLAESVLANLSKTTIVSEVDFASEKSGDLRLADNSPLKGRGVAIPNFTAKNNVDPGAFHAAKVQPARPLGVCVYPQQMNFTLKDGNVSAPETLTVKGICKEFSGKFTIRKNKVFDWFEVIPSSGVIRNGNELKLKVRIKPGFEAKAMRYRGAFIVRFEDGLSRPVSVYLNTDYKYDPYPEKEGVFTSYIDLAEPTRGKKYPVVECAAGGKGKMVDFRSDKPLYKKNEKGIWVFAGTEKDFSVYEFDVPSDGIYYIVFRGLVPKHSKPLTNSFFLSLNNAPLVEQYLTLSFGADVSWVWPKLPQSLNITYECKALKLKKGKNILKIAPRRDIYLDAACLTNDVRIFVTR